MTSAEAPHQTSRSHSVIKEGDFLAYDGFQEFWFVDMDLVPYRFITLFSYHLTLRIFL